MLSAVHYKLSRVKLLHLLNELKNNSINVVSLYVPAGSPRVKAEDMMKTILDLNIVPGELSSYMGDSPTGAILFWGPGCRYLVIPPFPMNEARTSNTCDIEPLQAVLRQPLLFGLVLIRLGAYAIGVVKGQNLCSSKVGTGLVHARHRQGGSSAHRFERHREKQIETYFTRVCGHVREQLEPIEKQLEFLFYGGTRDTLLQFRKQCQFMRQFDERTLDILLNIRQPRQSGLQEAIQEAWSSRIIQWKE